MSDIIHIVEDPIISHTKPVLGKVSKNPNRSLQELKRLSKKPRAFFETIEGFEDLSALFCRNL